ncbi:hypothetical protein BAE44_0016001 [Dichanthelium oligosanthes]|uniref:Uncharacterized protein n=1 Tax=Dichanthelium oligosanthes TaxID=888268 RepID=A0A1E5VCW5_9POAL|nr:hypothetical protein BAE44_0016001 [Dichanthelium oligosanthes]
MEAAPSANPRREPPPIPPNYVSLRKLQELRLKEKEEQERRRREQEAAAAARREAALKEEKEKKEQEKRRREEEAAAAAAAAAKREEEKAAMAAAINWEAARKAETKGRAISWKASGGAKERTPRGGQGQGQGHQWVAVAHRAPATTPRPMASGHGAAGKREPAIGGGPDDKEPDNVPHGGGNARMKWKGKGKGKGKEKLAEAAPAPSHGGKPAEVVPASSHGGKLGNKSESKAKGKASGGQPAESGLSGGPGGPVEAAMLSSRGRSRCRRPTGAGGRSAETCTGIALVKAAGLSPPRGVEPDDMGKPKPPAPRRADAVAGGGSPDGKKAAPAQAPHTSAADGSSKPTSGGELRTTTELKVGGLVEGQRRRPVVEAQAVGELNPRAARCSAGGPWRGRGNEAAEQHVRVWVPKAAEAAAGSSAGAGL